MLQNYSCCGLGLPQNNKERTLRILGGRFSLFFTFQNVPSHHVSEFLYLLQKTSLELSAIVEKKNTFILV
jgi:hypothetical protein